MNITIIGSGNVGKALAENLSTKGHKIVLGLKNSDDENIKEFLKGKKNITSDTVNKSVKNCDAIIFSIPPQAIEDVLNETGDINDKILIDATNTISSKPGKYNNTFEAIKSITKNEKVVKCFNTTGFENMLNPRYGDIGIDMFVAGTNEEAKRIAIELAKDAGFDECYDFGGDEKVDLLEKFALSWINLAIFQNEGRNIAFKILKR